MSEKDFEHLIDTLSTALAPKESGFSMSMTTVVTIFIAIMSGIATVTGFLVIGYYSNFSDIKAEKVWTRTTVVEIQKDMEELKSSAKEQTKILTSIREDQERRFKKEMGR